MKTYVLIVSRVFPSYHRQKGKETYFVKKIMNGVFKKGYYASPHETDMPDSFTKIHTIRCSYNFWKKRIDEVNAGKAILSLRVWAGKPYHKDENGIGQIEICKFDKHSGIGIQKIEFDTKLPPLTLRPLISKTTFVGLTTIAHNDGLSLEDFKEWFKPYKFDKPLCIIHFSNFRY